MNLSASNLRYRLISGPLELEPLRVLATRCMEWNGRSVTFCVLGASHAVCMQHGDTTITELLACCDLENRDDILLDIAGDPLQTACRIVAGLVCQVELIPFPLTEGDALRDDYPEANRLELAYPASADGPTPFTRIGWRIHEGALYVETIHTYPEERLGIRSRSRFCREEEGI